jgi:hypothetical protein
MKAKLVACALVVALTSPVSAATYYVMQSTRTQKCSVALRAPLAKSKAYKLVGNDTGYQSRKEATDAIKTIGGCKT